CEMIAEAARNGAELIAFPEVFIAGYPYWNWTMTPVKGSSWYEKLYKSSLPVANPRLTPLFEAARKHEIVVVVGMNERGESLGEIYNTNLIIDADGTLLARHRKLVPTWAEKLSWTAGDGDSLRVFQSKVGPIGTLACGENTNTL